MNKPDILVRHAKDNVWGEPGQDFNHNIHLQRLTPDGGVMTSFTYRFLKIYTPTHGATREWFHIYQVGQLPPVIFDMLPKLDQWTPITDIIVNQSLMIDIYLASGGVIPHQHAWIMKDRSRNLLVCVKRDRSVDFGVDAKVDEYTGVMENKPIYLDIDRAHIRFYSNYYMTSNRFRNISKSPEQPIKLISTKITMQSDWHRFVEKVIAIKQLFGTSGFGVWYEDGFLISEPLGFTNNMMGKRYTFIWDETFKSKVVFDIKGLPSFKSIKDYGARKYLLVTDNVYDVIDYHDDIDFYIVKKIGAGFKGVFVSRIQPSVIRMVSHNAYAIDAELVEYYIQTHAFLGNVNECSILLNIREGGMSHGLINQKNRVEELYRLTYPQIMNAYTETLSLVPEWHAAQLENSAYTQLISAPSEKITLDLAEEAYGYSAAVNAVIPPLQTVSNGIVNLPPGLCIPHVETGNGNRSIFCYNGDGVLLGYYNDGGLDDRSVINSNLIGVTDAEIFNMVADDDCGTWVNVNVSSNRLDQYGFSCYVSTEKNGSIAEDWEDITGTTTYYTYTPGTAKTKASIVWNWSLLTQSGLYPAVKTNDKIAIHQTLATRADFDGCLNITATARQYWNNAYLVRTNSIPPAVVDVFVNGLTLIENVDYVMKWPQIVILNRWMAKNDSNVILVRSYGCGNPETNDVFKPREVGFIKNGMASINGVYDVRNDKPVRMVYDNRLRRPSEMSFGENPSSVVLTDGRPYAVLDYIVPIEPFTNARSNEGYIETTQIDERVSNYLTMYLPEQPAILPRVERYRWELYSPVLASLIWAMGKGYISDASTESNFTNVDADKWLAPYRWMFDFDPAFLKFDENYFYISPHPFDQTVTVTQKQYELLRLINQLYLNGRVNFTNFITISNPGV